MYEKILIPTDGSDTAAGAVDHGIDLAEKYDAEVHALYVVDTDSMSITLGGEQLDRIEQGQFDEMDEIRERAESATGYVADRARERDVPAVEHISAGRPHSLIGDYVEDNGIDLVVMGSHGRSGITRALLGSVTERTLRSTHVPILVVDAQAE
ncbi:universal stress protein UspA [Halobiforma lacisalsi AJ5]|uniref:Universal stress protein UspA n=1 Tax=Natronobacterium lacisalsi AJ5 TaxID=358396 RepID=M0LTX4_NATLA|nr:universal stress protein [Halobiforma lacisalsi]APW99673.1 universal stress protein UspA [Halobiforma lacisalsi AJ5]EMA35535.1 UspA domain-containing protein [Halobiforma lacisalsi AJ5]